MYVELDTDKESERFKNFKKGVKRKEFHKRFIKTCRHFKKLEDLIENKFYDCSAQFDGYFCRSKSSLIATVLKDGKQQRLRYF